jgi:hypothetical protein
VVGESGLQVVVNATAYGNYQGESPDNFRPDIDYSARQILFTDPYEFKGPLDVEEGTEQELTITIDGLTNPLNNEPSASFEIVTFNRVDDVLYFID